VGARFFCCIFRKAEKDGGIFVADKRFYITTPIYYPSDRLHIGHAYTTTATDALARWHRFNGEDVLFLTGSDEHGQKIERIAKQKGVSPQEYVDGIVAGFKELWKRLNISYDDFVRTTEERHQKVAQTVFQKLYEKGDVYKGAYEGLYCTPCETFWVESKLIDGKCPDCGRPVELVREEAYFLRLSKYADRLLKHIEENPDFIQPETRRNEMVSFIKGGLEDLCVTRTSIKWGIPIPNDKNHVLYVWVDALTNYLTGAGYLSDEAKFAKFWPADIHVVGKEIMRFHTIIWPIILMALDLPLPKTIFGHGWLLFDGEKMSKSKGNVVDPNALIDEFGADAIRYFLLREIAFGQDGNFSRRALMERINSDLANDLGNLVHRTLSMLQKYRNGIVPAPKEQTDLDKQIIELFNQVVGDLRDQIEQCQLNTAMVTIWRFIGRMNKYVDETEPWALARDPEKQERLDTVLYNFMEALRLITLLVKSFMPETGQKMWQQLGITESLEDQTTAQLVWGLLKPGTQTQKGQPLFPRLDLDAEAEDEADVQESQLTKTADVSKTPASQAAPAQGNESKEEDGANIIEISDFAKADLRVAQVLTAEKVVGTDKLLKLSITLGDEERQIVAGIAQHYSPSELVGKKIVVVANLKPAKLRGILSQGMLLAASLGGQLSLVTPERDVPVGAKVK